MTKTCEQMREWLPEYAEGKLDGPRAAALGRHLATCARCRAEVADLRTVLASLHGLAPEPLPGHLLPEVRAAIRRTAPRPRPTVRTSRPFWPRLALPIVAATGVIAIGFMLHTAQNQARLASLESPNRNVMSHTRMQRQAEAEPPPSTAPGRQAARVPSAPEKVQSFRAGETPPRAESAAPAAAAPRPQAARAKEDIVAGTQPSMAMGKRRVTPRKNVTAPAQPAEAKQEAYSGPPLPPSLLRAHADAQARQAAAAKATPPVRTKAAEKAPALTVSATPAGPAGAPGPSGANTVEGGATRPGAGGGLGGGGAGGPRGPERGRYPEGGGRRAEARPNWHRVGRSAPYPRLRDRETPKLGYPGGAARRGGRGAPAPAAPKPRLPVITLQVAAESLGRDVQVRAAGRVIWSTATARGKPITLTAEQIGAGPSAIPITVSSESARRSYMLFVPALARLGEASPGPLKRYRNAMLSAVLHDVSSRTGRVLLVEGPLNRRVQCDLPFDSPATAIEALAQATGYRVSTADNVVYSLSLE